MEYLRKEIDTNNEVNDLIKRVFCDKNFNDVLETCKKFVIIFLPIKLECYIKDFIKRYILLLKEKKQLLQDSAKVLICESIINDFLKNIEKCKYNIELVDKNNKNSCRKIIEQYKYMAEFGLLNNIINVDKDNYILNNIDEDLFIDMYNHTSKGISKLLKKIGLDIDIFSIRATIEEGKQIVVSDSINTLIQKRTNMVHYFINETVSESDINEYIVAINKFCEVLEQNFNLI